MKIVISTIFQNGGDATRAIEIAKIIKMYQPDTVDVEIIFISRGSRFEKYALELGFTIYHASPKMKGVNFLDDLKSKFGELIGDTTLATAILQGEIEAYKEIKPDIVIYGFWPIASIAKRMVLPNIKGIAFLPLPLTEAFLNQIKSFPDEMFLSYLPKSIQKYIFQHIPSFIKEKIPALRHKHIKKATEQLGWKGESLNNIFDMLRSDRYFINDFPIFYKTEEFGEKFIFTGAVYSEISPKKIDDPNIKRILSKENKKIKIFCTLGSSGNKNDLLEIIKIFNSPQGLDWSGIILSPKAICPIEEARATLKNSEVYITDKFVPAKEINKKVDMVICHGGQGTLQTSITSGKPLIGVATQPEQKINLEHLEDFGMAIRIPRRAWKKERIEKETINLIKNFTHYTQKAMELKKIYAELDTKEIIGRGIWREIMESINNSIP